MTRRNIVGMLLSRFNYNRVTVTIVHISVREWLPNSVTVHGPKYAKNQRNNMESGLIRRKNHEKQGARGKKWRFFHNFATFARERLLNRFV